MKTDTELLNSRATVAFTEHFLVTPSDTVDLARGPCRAFHVDVAGYVKFTDARGNTDEMYFVAGVTHHHSAKRIFATTVGSGATGIHACY